ncbi:hypothetical protein Scel_79790 [Streptomyces cellostaticus]|nr:hypothetical protein Scel_79790 [Streptomyces cellostaticus]
MAAVGQRVPPPHPAEDLQDGPLLGARVVPGGGAAVGDEGPAGSEQPPGVGDAAPAEVVEDGVDPAGGEFPDPGRDVLGAVVEGVTPGSRRAWWWRADAVPITFRPAARASWTRTVPTPPFAPWTRTVPPLRTRALRCSICHAVIPLTTSVSASAAPIPAGTSTASAASRTT